MTNENNADLETRLTELEKKLDYKVEALTIVIEQMVDLLSKSIDKLRNDTRDAFKVEMTHLAEIERDYVIPSFSVTHPKTMDTLNSLNKVIGATSDTSDDLYRVLATSDPAERIERIMDGTNPKQPDGLPR